MRAAGLVVAALTLAALAGACARGGPEIAAIDEPRAAHTPVSPSTDDPEPDPAGAYTPVVREPGLPGALPRAMMEHCRDDIVAAGQDPSAEWISVKSSRNTFRHQVIARRNDEGVRVQCRLPRVVVPREVPEPIATDDAGILRQCSSVAGYDFTGWTVVTSMVAAQGVEAVLGSTNGYTAYCSLQPGDWDSGSDQVVEMPAGSDAELGRRQQDGSDLGLHGSSLSIKTAHTPIEGQLWNGSGILYDERGRIVADASRIVFTFSDTGERFVVPVVRGRWAARIHRVGATGGLGDYRAAVVSRSGEVLQEYTSASS
ncbi:MAG TPA: hypothetical protein VLA97_17565 [Nocardioidaceae bacterium]|nr:hypothetical protein [Nocardioidaceae bacterium]